MSHHPASIQVKSEIQIHLCSIEVLWVQAVALGNVLLIGNRNLIIIFGGSDALHFYCCFDLLK